MDAPRQRVEVTLLLQIDAISIHQGKFDPAPFRKTLRFHGKHASPIAEKTFRMKWYVYFEKPL